MIVFDDALGVPRMASSLSTRHQAAVRRWIAEDIEPVRHGGGVPPVRGSNFVVQACRWEKIQVVGGGGASRQGEFGERVCVEVKMSSGVMRAQMG